MEPQISEIFQCLKTISIQLDDIAITMRPSTPVLASQHFRQNELPRTPPICNQEQKSQFKDVNHTQQVLVRRDVNKLVWKLSFLRDQGSYDAYFLQFARMVYSIERLLTLDNQEIIQEELLQLFVDGLQEDTQFYVCNSAPTNLLHVMNLATNFEDEVKQGGGDEGNGSLEREIDEHDLLEESTLDESRHDTEKQSMLETDVGLRTEEQSFSWDEEMSSKASSETVDVTTPKERVVEDVSDKELLSDYENADVNVDIVNHAKRDVPELKFGSMEYKLPVSLVITLKLEKGNTFEKIPGINTMHVNHLLTPRPQPKLTPQFSKTQPSPKKYTMAMAVVPSTPPNTTCRPPLKPPWAYSSSSFYQTPSVPTSARPPPKPPWKKKPMDIYTNSWCPQSKLNQPTTKHCHRQPTKIGKRTPSPNKNIEAQKGKESPFGSIDHEGLTSTICHGDQSSFPLVCSSISGRDRFRKDGFTVDHMQQPRQPRHRDQPSATTIVTSLNCWLLMLRRLIVCHLDPSSLFTLLELDLGTRSISRRMDLMDSPLQRTLAEDRHALTEVRKVENVLKLAVVKCISTHISNGLGPGLGQK